MSEELKRDLMEDPDEMVLQEIMGDRFQVLTNQPAKRADAKPKASAGNAKPVQKKTPVQEAPAKIFDTKPGFFEKLRECGKWSMVFGGLCVLVFYWQQTGQMMPSAAVPSMMACTAGAAWCVGRACK